MPLSDTFWKYMQKRRSFKGSIFFFFPASFAPHFGAFRLNPKVWVTQPSPGDKPLAQPQVLDPMSTYG